MKELNHELDYRQQSEKVSLRLPSDELQMLKRYSRDNGVPYSVVIKSLIFKFNRNMIEFL